LIDRQHGRIFAEYGGPLTLGVEEEFHLVDLATRRLTARAGEVLDRLAPTTLDGAYAAELQRSVVETNTAVTSSLDTLQRHLIALRSALIETADCLGLGVAGAGMMPLSAPLEITELPRYRRMLSDYQLLAREQLICGMHVHVGMPDRDLGARLLDRLSRWLPPLLALSASSPFSHAGEDTGYASTRSLIWSRWPTSGTAGRFASAPEYNAYVQDLIASGVISDAKMIYFDVRLSAHVPTLELRVCDACPLVDTVVLIAGLFRAIVLRELTLELEGRASRALPSGLQRAAMWRAARSGLEAELVDLSGPRSVPAGVLLNGMLNELRPELEWHGDWDRVQLSCQAALRRGSSARRQRDVLRTRSPADVVDSLLAETRGALEDEVAPSLAMPFLSGYAVLGYDEALRWDRRPRATHAGLLSGLCQREPMMLAEHLGHLERLQISAGAVFRPTGSDLPLALPLDLIPRVLAGEEWSKLQGGTAQRARALDAFVRDIYGDRAIVRDGIIPESVVRDSPGYVPASSTAWPGARRTHVCGFDLVRDAEGRWRVLEDNVRVPSGVAYAIQYRRLMRAVIPELMASLELIDPEPATSLLRAMLEESAPPRATGNALSIALLTAGASDSAYFEHRMLAEAIGAPLVLPADLAVVDDELWYEGMSGRQRIDVLYRRIDELSFVTGANGAPLGAQLAEAVRAGSLTLANAIGTGVADDKSIYAHVPKFIEYYLGEHPLLEQVPTYHCSCPEQRSEVLRRLHELVIKPVDGYGGADVLIGPHAKEEELARARALIIERPHRWIAQDTISLSTHPTLSGPRLQPRHVDLRVFVYYGSQPTVVPAPLTSVAPHGSLVVNSSRGGGAKDTWVLE
jgi:glutamate---cysteine ligase / carboxylate-amine ligase